MFVKKLGLLLLSTSLLAACGGSDSDETPLPVVPPPVTETPDPTEYNLQVQGVVAYQGAVAGADVCADLNMDQLCGADEPFSTTNNDGHYQIDWVSETQAPAYYLIANWIDADANNSSNPAPSQLLSSTFKSEKLKPTSVVTSASTAIQGQSASTVISNGDGQLIAMSAHNGAINALTHLEFQRYAQMLAQALSADEIQALRLQLSTILNALYAPLTGQAYQVTADMSATDEFVNTYLSHQHITDLIGDRLLATLAIDEVLAASKASIDYLALQNDMAISEYLASDPIDVRFIVNDTLIAQGYIVTPFDNKIMADSDWDIIQNNLINDDLEPHKFSLAPTHLKSFYSLAFGDPNQNFFGFISNNTLTGSLVNTDNTSDVAMVCWNSQLEIWINPERDDQGYEPIQPSYENNTINTHYLGTTTAINVQIEKHQSSGETWETIVNTLPEQLQLTNLQWPEFIYRYHIVQTEDVICRTEITEKTWDMPQHNSIEQLTTADIAMLFWADFYPNDVIIDEAMNQLSIEYTAGVISTFEWEIDTTPQGLPLLRTIEMNLPIERVDGAVFGEYLVEDTKIIEVEIHQANSFDDINDYLLISYDGEDNNFSQRFLAHLSSLLPISQP